MDLTKKEDEKVNIILKKDNNYNKDNMNNMNEEEKIKKLKEDLIKAKEIEKNQKWLKGKRKLLLNVNKKFIIYL